MADFNILVNDVDRLHTIATEYHDGLLDSLAYTLDTIQFFIADQEFQGAAADSMKAYYSEVHLPLIASIVSLADQILADYRKEYANGFTTGTVSEHKNAQLPSGALVQANSALDELNKSIVAVRVLLDKAFELMPSDFASRNARPQDQNEPPIRATIVDQKNWNTTIRRGVETLEDDGVQLIRSEDSAYAALRSALSGAIAACAKTASPVTYQSGSFGQIAIETGLIGAVQNSKADQTAWIEITNEAANDLCSRNLVREQEALEAERKAKEEALIWGTIGAIAVVVVGAVAVVATGGVAGAVLGSIGLACGAMDLSARTQQLYSFESGDAFAKKEGVFDKVAPYIKEGKSEAGLINNTDRIRKGLMGEGEHAYKTKDGLAGDMRYKENKMNLEKGAAGIAKAAVSKAIGDWTDFVGDVAGGGEAAALIDAGSEFVDEGVGLLIDSGVTGGIEISDIGSGFAGAAGKAVEAVADYHAEEADKGMQQQIKEMAKTQEMRNNINMSSEREWFDWSSIDPAMQGA